MRMRRTCNMRLSERAGIRVLIGLGLVAGIASAQAVVPADAVLVNGKIITVDERFTIAQAVAVRGERVVAVGSNADIGKMAGPSTRRIDLRGRAVIPGLIATEWREVWAENAGRQRQVSKQQFLDGICRDWGIVAGRWGMAREVADAVVFLASDRAAYINGAKLTVDGGYAINVRS